jgi:hypothetical protein
VAKVKAVDGKNEKEWKKEGKIRVGQQPKLLYVLKLRHLENGYKESLFLKNLFLASSLLLHHFFSFLQH